jgi:hypothetical protein
VIDRIAANDIATFYDRYYAHEEPVIITGAGAHGIGGGDSRGGALRARIADDPASIERLLWFDVRPEVLAWVCPTPPILQPLLDGTRAFCRRNFVRVWFSQRGDTTPWHYDGNSIHVCNLQLAGRKKWVIVSPDNPLSCIPFSNTCLFRDYALEGKRHHEFTLDEGELLFLPRYWFHRVESLGEQNININWVLTPLSKPTPSRTAQREAELIWLKSWLSRMTDPLRRRPLDPHTLLGREVLYTAAADVSTWSGFMRAVRELSRLWLFLLSLPTQIGRMASIALKKPRLRGAAVPQQMRDID